MYRFVAFSWSRNSAAGTVEARRLERVLLSSSADWQCVLDTPCLRVFHAPQPRGACHAYVLKRGAGVVLGKLFAKNLGAGHFPFDPTFDDKESELLVETQGRHLVERYWGHYVAFLREPNSERHFVVRDPTGGLCCFLTTSDGVDVILTDMEDCARLKIAPFSVDWDHLTAFFVHDRLVTRTTGFKEVTQLYAGECVAMEDGRRTYSFYWDPVGAYEADTIENPDEARATLRAVVRYCVGAWSSCYESIVHELSGGLDSSVVAACLGRNKVRSEVLCFHYFTEMSEGDERRYAREAAQSAGCELVEAEANVSERSLASLLNPSKIATPAVLGFLPAAELLKQRLVNERHAGAIFSGQGGDHLFQQGKNKHIAAEYAHRHGVHPQLLRVVTETSRLTKQSIWSIFSIAVSYGLLRRSFDPYTVFEAPSILTDDARTSVSPHAYVHPWVQNASRLPASKIRQVLDIVDCQPFYQRPCPSAEQIHPLISLPIIERCLQMPTYVLAHRGRDRGLLREAFEAEVPVRIIYRRSKSSTASYFTRILLENVRFLREYLLDGVLVRKGLLDRRELEKQLSERELILGNEVHAILNAARAEKWLSIWADVRQRTAA
jgi:asparagine synthase (glutamine-hydrolysing)